MALFKPNFGGEVGSEQLIRDPTFDDLLDEEHGEILIAGYGFRASDVLASDANAYRAALLDHRQQQDEELRELVTSSFPFPIAHCFARFVDGWDTQNQRLQFLKDAWEAIVAVLFALALGELRERRETVVGSTVRAKHVGSKNVAARIEVIGQTCRAVSDLWITRLVDDAALERMRKLHRRRSNDFAHSGTLNERQSELLVRELEREVLAILRSLEPLQEIELVRYLGPGDDRRGTVKLETFVGESARRSIDRARSVSDAQKLAFAEAGKTDILAVWEDRVIRLSPLICWRERDAGHDSQLVFFKEQRSAKVLSYEVLGASQTYDEVAEHLIADLRELKACFRYQAVAKQVSA